MLPEAERKPVRISSFSPYSDLSLMSPLGKLPGDWLAKETGKINVWTPGLGVTEDLQCGAVRYWR